MCQELSKRLTSELRRIGAMRYRRLQRLVVVSTTLAVLVMAAQLGAFCQINTATLSGNVKDSADAAIPGASVVVLQVLTGMKEGPDSMWKLSYVGGASKDALARTEMTGLFLQVAVLVAAIAATEYFIRRKSAGRVSRVPSMRKTN